MLAPNDRTLLLDALRPPTGFVLDRAVGTTFTLELGTALMVPLAFAGFSLSASPDPIAVMEAVRTTADRVDVFCQAGMVKAERWPSDLVALLENVIHEVPRPRPGHLFHPKTWAVRYVSDDGDTAYRCLVLSRNLTADRSWDVILRLDGEASRLLNPDNDGLVRFIGALPEWAHRLPAERAEPVAELADQLRKVHWERPEGVNDVAFVPFGVPGMRSPDTRRLFRGSRHLVISPFVTEDGLQTLLGDSTARAFTVVARGEELDRVGPGPLADTSVYTINTLAGLDTDEDADEDATEGVNQFGGLHAKVYVVELGQQAHVFLGSANATGATFGGNVELLCHLTGGRKALGLDTMLGEKAPFRALLEAYQPGLEAVTDPVGDAARALEAYLIDVAEVGFAVSVTHDGAGWVPVVRSDKPLPALPDNSQITLDLAPYNRSAEQFAITPGERVNVDLAARSAAELTPFLLVSASATIDRVKVDRRIVVTARLEGAPGDRLDDILVRQIDTPEKFLRLLFLLLGLGTGGPLSADLVPGDGGSTWTPTTSGIFEVLVRALATQPEKIDHLGAIVARLQTTDAGKSVLPDGWASVWDSVVEARAKLVKK